MITGKASPRDDHGRPDFRFVATHICDSIKRRLKVEGLPGLQGEFGIGLLSFWTLGEELTLTSTGADERASEMVMRKGDLGYSVRIKRILFLEPGTQLKVSKLLDGIRTLSGERIRCYLASELRDRIRKTGVRISVLDKISRKQFAPDQGLSRRDRHPLGTQTSLIVENLSCFILISSSLSITCRCF